MSDLIYTVNTSLDGFVNDVQGSIDFTFPSDEVVACITDLEREVGTYLYGRRLYESMAIWEDLPLDDEPQVMRDFAEVWRVADKVVYSVSLDAVSTSRTRLERRFDPAAVSELVASAERSVSVGGATLAASAIRAGLVTEFRQFVYPVVLGGGTPWLPADVRLELQLIDERRFESGAVHLRYRTKA